MSSAYSGDAEIPRKSRLLMLNHMAVKSPVARVVCNEGDVERLFLEQQGGVSPVGEDRPLVGTHRLEGQSMQVDGMHVRALIAQAQDVAAAHFQCCQWPCA